MIQALLQLVKYIRVSFYKTFLSVSLFRGSAPPPMLFPEHLTCEVRQGLIIHQEERPNLPLLQKISGCCQGCEDFIFSNVEAQFRQPLQQVSLAFFRCVGHKPNRNRSAAQPDGWRAKSLLPRTTSHLHTSYGFWRLKNECLSKGCR